MVSKAIFMSNIQKKIPTPEEFLEPLQTEYGETGEYRMYFGIDLPDAMKKYAKEVVKYTLE